MTSILDSLKPRTVPVEVTLPYGGKVTVPMCTLSLYEYDELGEVVLNEIAPFVRFDNQGREVRNYDDPAYLLKREKAESERRYRRLTMAMLKGGNEIPGFLFEEQVKNVRDNLDLSIAMSLMRWQAALIATGRARVVELANNFPVVEEAPADADVAGGSDAGAVAQPE